MFVPENKGPRGMWVADLETYFRSRYDGKYSRLRDLAIYHTRNLSAWARGQAPRWLNVKGEVLTEGVLYVSVP